LAAHYAHRAAPCHAALCYRVAPSTSPAFIVGPHDQVSLLATAQVSAAMADIRLNALPASLYATPMALASHCRLNVLRDKCLCCRPAEERRALCRAVTCDHLLTLYGDTTATPSPASRRLSVVYDIACRSYQHTPPPPVTVTTYCSFGPLRHSVPHGSPRSDGLLLLHFPHTAPLVSVRGLSRRICFPLRRTYRGGCAPPLRLCAGVRFDLGLARLAACSFKHPWTYPCSSLFLPYVTPHEPSRKQGAPRAPACLV